MNKLVSWVSWAEVKTIKQLKRGRGSVQRVSTRYLNGKSVDERK